MPASAIVTVVIVVLVILLLVGFMLVVARVLADVNKQLAAVTAAVGAIAEKTGPVDAAVRSIDEDLGSAREALTALLESKVGPERAAKLVESVDPLAAPPAAEEPSVATSPSPADDDWFRDRREP